MFGVCFLREGGGWGLSLSLRELVEKTGTVGQGQMLQERTKVSPKKYVNLFLDRSKKQ